MSTSQVKKRVVAITLALGITFVINTAISYAAKANSTSTSTSEQRSGGTSQIPDPPKP